MMAHFSYVRPRSLKEAIGHLAENGARVHAGGTDLLGCLRDQVFDVRKVVSISGLSAMRGVEQVAGGGLRIGALTTIAEISEHPLIRKHYTALAQGASEVASPQLRNQGTLGGNLCQKPRCWYYRGEFHCMRKGGDVCYAAGGENQFHCIFGSGGRCFIVHPSDTAPALSALDAQVEITGPGGLRTMPVENFHVHPEDDVLRETWLERGEIVTAVRLPAPQASLKSTYRKIRARRAWDFALAGAALALELDGDRVVDGRVVLSGAAPVPWRSLLVEDTIRGKTLDDRTIDAAADAVVKGARPLAKNKYKLPLFRGMIQEELRRIHQSAYAD
ncbi:MAG: xanthine dehydrogenase family protein subunit M [Desulfobacterales bacterium]|nr:xanthine dehydrogenase family protein subunit M [Desulfobacterales bacterium]